VYCVGRVTLCAVEEGIVEGDVGDILIRDVRRRSRRNNEEGKRERRRQDEGKRS
jgi:hypothetical protein